MFEEYADLSPDEPEWLREMLTASLEPPEEDRLSGLFEEAPVFAPETPASPHQIKINQAEPMDEPPDRVAAAIRDIGLDPTHLNRDVNPPAFVDPQTGAESWIGIYQPDDGDPNFAIASILTLIPQANGHFTAALAPVAQGTFEKAQQVTDHLLQTAEKAHSLRDLLHEARGMALAADQRDLWDTDLGKRVEIQAPDWGY